MIPCGASFGFQITDDLFRLRKKLKASAFLVSLLYRLSLPNSKRASNLLIPFLWPVRVRKCFSHSLPPCASYISFLFLNDSPDFISTALCYFFVRTPPSYPGLISTFFGTAIIILVPWEAFCITDKQSPGPFELLYAPGQLHSLLLILLPYVDMSSSP